MATSRSPEEIRHLSIRRRGRGYDRAEVDRLLAEIAESFEAVWHERTQFYEELRRDRAELTRLRDQTARADSDRDALIDELERARASIRELQAAMEQLEPARDEEGRLVSAEELRNERDRLLEEVQRMSAATVQERETRQRMIDFLLDGLKRVERTRGNGSNVDVGPSGGNQDVVPDDRREPTSRGQQPPDDDANR